MDSPITSEPLYTPLSHTAKEIRVLHINTDTLDSQERITCTLRPVSLLEHPTFEAISWSWGDQTLTKDILINDHPVRISAAAEEVLQTLCFKNGHSVVWLDALCINQSDLLERASQVSLMRDVYSSARQVLVWLGNDDFEESGEAFRSIDLLYAQCQQTLLAKSRKLDELFWDKEGQLLRSFDPLPECNWSALMAFFPARWFRRLWVVQEVMLNKQVLCYYGNSSRSWEEISLAAQWMWYRRYERNVYCGQQVAGVKTTSQKWCYAHRGFDITALLHMSAGLQVSVAYDKVYGMLGVLDRADDIFPTDFVNYGEKLSKAFAVATRAAILERKGSPHQLEVLRYAGVLLPPSTSQVGEEEDDWPTWVPHYHGKYSRINGSPSLPDRGFNPGVANNLPAVIKEEASSVTSLILQGLAFDKIRECGCILSYALLHHDPIRYSAEKQSWKSFTFLPEETVELALTGGRSLGQASHQTRPRDDIVWEQSANRRFFVTDKGHIGTGPPGMQAGDYVCILLGGRTPFVLRRFEGKSWQMLGAGYVQGIMQGEFMRELQLKGEFEGKKEWFKIH